MLFAVLLFVCCLNGDFFKFCCLLLLLLVSRISFCIKIKCVLLLFVCLFFYINFLCNFFWVFSHFMLCLNFLALRFLLRLVLSVKFSFFLLLFYKFLKCFFVFFFLMFSSSSSCFVVVDVFCLTLCCFFKIFYWGP